ncbi:AMP-binding protein [Propionivibrio limicola]|uniref:AMP-binding protein n=1 Tax=Propionivibrio limicola TaxID=167645 RepID=UPI001291B3BB|nr:AMP-binding protein [Propionivibrio limicola]
MSVATLFAALAARRPDAAVLHGSQGIWRAGALGAEIEAVAKRLAGTRVMAILADNSPDWAIADLAALKSSTVALPLPLFFTPAQLSHALTQSGADLVLTDQPERVLSLDLGFAVSETRRDIVWLRRRTAPVTLPDGTVKISFTSGSTGAPKGVCLSAGGLLDTARSLHTRLADLPIERHLAVLPLALLLENSAGLYAPLLRGTEIHLPSLASLGWQGMSGFNPQALQQAVAEVRPNSVILVPELLKAWSQFLARSKQSAPKELSYVAVGGSRVEASLLTQARRLGLPAYQGYGLTECGSVVSLNRPGDDGYGVGRPLPHVRTVIRSGEIHVATRAFLGYLGTPSPDAAEYATGDLGQFDEAGHLHLSGRRKNLLITSFGRNVSPEWVEAALLAQPQIAQALVAGDGQLSLAAIVVPFPGVADDELATAIGHANASLPDYARIGQWLVAAPFTPQNGQLTGNGRPVRTAILNHHAAALAALYDEQPTQEPAHVLL